MEAITVSALRFAPRLLLALAVLPACAASRPDVHTGAKDAPAGEPVVYRGAFVDGVGVTDITVLNRTITSVSPVTTDTFVDVSGLEAVPGYVDSHVHLAYLPGPEALAQGGLAGVVDLAAPLSFLSADHAPLRVLASGPMVTAPGGYPTTSWGRDGYGLECASTEAAVAAVDALVEAGAGVIKLPVTSEPQLSDEALAAVVVRAHARGVRVVSHALGDDEAARAAAAGVDALAHTPTERLSPDTVAAWSGRAVISTLAAFGGSRTAVDNLRRLREAGATVLYGTDYGNSQVAGIDPAELALLAESGMSAAEIRASATSVPAAYWGFPTLGRVAPGYDASFLLCDAESCRPSWDPGVGG